MVLWSPRVTGVLLGLAVCLVLKVSVLQTVGAETNGKGNSVAGEGEESRRSRARLSPALSEYLEEIRDERSESDFEWGALTGGGPASGAEPVIGDRNVASYYEFNDGHRYPYYIAKPLSGAK